MLITAAGHPEQRDRHAQRQRPAPQVGLEARSTVAAPTRANGTSASPARRCGGPSSSPARSARRRCGRGGRSPATAARRRRGRAGRGRCRCRRSPASSPAARRPTAMPAAIDRAVIRVRRATAGSAAGRASPARQTLAPAGRSSVGRGPNHGRVGGCSPRSWRRSRTTVRRSCIVTAKRSCDTRSPRRTSGSTRRSAGERDGDDAEGDDDGDADDVDGVDGASPTGRSCRSSRPARGCDRRWRSPGRPSTTRASPVASQRGTCRTWTITATATNSAPIAARAMPALAAHASLEPGSRRDASCPAMTPTSSAGERHRAQPLHDRSGQDLAARHRRQQEVADVGRFDRDRAAVAAAAQAEGDRQRRAGADDGRAVRRGGRRSATPSPGRRRRAR